jgi:putative salt-induced outer membrane protein
MAAAALLLLLAATGAADVGNGGGGGGDPKVRAEAEMAPKLQAMLDAAMKSGNEADVATISKYLRIAAPESADAIAEKVTAWAKDRAEKKEEVLRDAGFFGLWKGRLELGGSITTGNTDTKGASVVFDLNRDGYLWRQKVHLVGEYQENLGIASREHLLGSYEANYKLDSRAYIYGQAQAESDRFSGFYSRFSTSVGGGYSAVKTSDITLDLELGPAFRATSFTDDRDEKSVAVRGSMGLGWKLTKGLSFREDTSGYLERYNSTLSSTTALQAKLFGPLALQVSYNVQYESEPPIGSVSTDTTTRGSLVYTF